MRFTIGVLIVAMTAVMPSLYADDCSVVLLQRNVDQAARSQASLRAWLSIVDQNNFATAREAAKGEALYEAFFASGDYSSFNEKRDRYFSQTGGTETKADAEAHLRSTLPEAAIPAWIECQRLRAQGNSGLTSYIENVDATGATITIVWNPPPGINDLTNVNAAIVGGEVVGDATHISVLHRGNTSLVLKRTTRSSPIRGSVNGSVSNAGQYSTTIYVPAPPVETRAFSRVYLSDLPADALHATNVHGGLARNRVYWQDQVWIGGNQYAKALGIHPPPNGVATVDVRVPDGASWFKAYAGFARADTATDCAGDVSYRVLLDGTPIIAQRFQGTHANSPNRINVAVVPGMVLRIEVAPNGDNYCDHFTLGDAVFE